MSNHDGPVDCPAFLGGLPAHKTESPFADIRSVRSSMQVDIRSRGPVRVFIETHGPIQLTVPEDSRVIISDGPWAKPRGGDHARPWAKPRGGDHARPWAKPRGGDHACPWAKPRGGSAPPPQKRQRRDIGEDRSEDPWYLRVSLEEYIAAQQRLGRGTAMRRGPRRYGPH